MVTKQAEELRQIVLDILSAAGTTDENASDVAEHLVIADMSGVVTHGVTQLPGYIDAIRADELLPCARPETLRELDAGALITGNWTFGQVAAKYAAELGIKKAGATGVALVSIVQSHHIGRLGHYVEMAASEGMISLVCAGGFGAIDPQTVPYGGRTRVLHTNPIAMGFPVADAPPIDVRLRNHGALRGEGGQRPAARRDASAGRDRRCRGEPDHRPAGLLRRRRPSALRRAQGLRADDGCRVPGGASSPGPTTMPRRRAAAPSCATRASRC